MAFPADWTYSTKITIDSSLIDSSLTDFPLLVKLSASNFDFALAKSDGSDIRFTLDDEVTLLKFERERHDNISELAEYHVKVPSVSSSVDTVIYMYYGNDAASDGEDAINTWDANFLFVSHMYDVNTSTIKNSVDGSSKSKSSANNPIETDGEVYKAQNFSSDAITVGDIDIDGDGTIESLVNPSGFASQYGNCILARANQAALAYYSDLSLLLSNTNGYVYIQTGSLPTSFQSYISTLQASTGAWQYVAGRADGVNLSAFLGTTKQTTPQTTTPAGNTTNYKIGHYGDATSTHLYFDGSIGEVRLSNMARSDAWLKATKESLFDGLLTFKIVEAVSIDETITLDDTWKIQTIPEFLDIDETITLDDTWQAQTNPAIIDIDETITLSDSWLVETVENADLITKIIFTNFLIFVTDMNPAKIFKVDITDPTNPITTGEILIGVQGTKSVSYNATTGFLYVACKTGKVVKVDYDDFSIQTIIDLTDTDDLETIDNFDVESITFISTDATLGELHMLDERETSIIDTNFQFLQENTTQIDTLFDWIEAKLIDTNFQFLQENTTDQINTDFKWSPALATITPVARPDFDVKINGVSLTGDDLVLDSPSVTHTIGEDDFGTFRVARYHDALDQTIDGVSSIITSQNAVKIYINGNLELDGNVSNINCVFEEDQEYVIITATGEQQTESRQNVTMSLPNKTSQLGLYDVLIQNPVIDNPIIDPDDENPKFFKGIKVQLGTKIEQSISRYRYFGSTTSLAEKVSNGEFDPKQNWAYFWFGAARNFITNSIFAFLRYLGTSIGSLAGDSWEIQKLSYRRQRVFDDIETELGEYTVGEAPFDEVSTENGILIPADKWVDKPDGLYREKDAGYNYEDYAKQVAALELEKIQTINNEVAPKTSTSMIISIDAYYYYALKLLTRINIDNTTQANIFKNNKGFPVSIKSIVISANAMNVSLITDNLKSIVELEEIDDRYPDPDSDEFKFPAKSVKNFTKFDPNTLGTIE